MFQRPNWWIPRPKHKKWLWSYKGPDLDCHGLWWLLIKDLRQQEPNMRGEMTIMTFFIRLWHAPSEMQLTGWSGTPRNEMHKEFWPLTEGWPDQLKHLCGIVHAVMQREIYSRKRVIYQCSSLGQVVFPTLRLLATLNLEAYRRYVSKVCQDFRCDVVSKIHIICKDLCGDGCVMCTTRSN